MSGDEVWARRHPDNGLVRDETPVGVGANRRFAYVAGTKYLSNTTSVFEVVKYRPHGEGGMGNIEASFTWPSLTKPNHVVRTAVAAAFVLGEELPNSDLDMYCYVTGYQPTSIGMRIVTVATFSSDPVDPSLPGAPVQLLWSAFENLTDDPNEIVRDEYPVAIVADDAHVVVIGKSYTASTGWDIVCYAYDATTGARIAPALRYPTLTGSNEVPVGGVLTKTANADPAVVVAATVDGGGPEDHHRILLAGWQIKDNPNAVPLPTYAGTPLQSAIVRQELTPATYRESDIAKGISAPAPNVVLVEPKFAVTGTRYHDFRPGMGPPGRHTDFVTGVYGVPTGVAPAGTCGVITEDWVQTFDYFANNFPTFTSDAEDAAAVLIHLTSGTDNFTRARVTVTGTTQSPIDSHPRIAAVSYYLIAAAPSASQAEWFGKYEPNPLVTPYTGEFGAVAMTAGDPAGVSGSPLSRLFIAGFGSRVVDGSWNRDQVCICFGAQGLIPPEAAPVERGPVWAKEYPDPLVDIYGEDIPTGISLHNNMNPMIPTGAGLFMTGRSDSVSRGRDWVTRRINP